MFILKKIISYSLSPLSIYLLIALAGTYYVWRQKAGKAARITMTLVCVFFIIMGYGTVFKTLAVQLEKSFKPIPPDCNLSTIKWVVVLGAGMSSDTALPLTSQLSEGTTIRTVEGIRLWRRINNAQLIFSGGAVFNTQSEAKGMSALAKELGVPESSIVLEDKSLDTDDQARLIKELVKEERIILVTSAAHMRRSAALFRKAGVDYVPAPTNHRVMVEPVFKPSKLFPDAGNLLLAEIVCHEYLGLLWSKLRGRI